MSFIPYGRQDIDEKDIEAVTNVLKSDYLTCGPTVNDFEMEFANYVGCKHAVSFSNATAALHVAVKALITTIDESKRKKKVITTPITFAASANCVLYNDLEVEFVDIDPDTYLMDLDLLEKRLEADPEGYQGVIPVDFAGLPIDIERLKSIADKYSLWIIEDACHAPGGGIETSKGYEKCGASNYADMTIFSFHPVKHLACGEGGMICTNNPDLDKGARLYRSHGIVKSDGAGKPLWFQEMKDLGFNYRMPDINAALGRTQLKKLDNSVKRRNEISKVYENFCEAKGIKYQANPKKALNAHHLFVIEVEKRDELFTFLREKQIGTQIHYVPVYLHPYYQELGFKKGDCPHAERYFERCISIPMYPTLKDEEVEKVKSAIGEFLG